MNSADGADGRRMNVLGVPWQGKESLLDGRRGGRQGEDNGEEDGEEEEG